MWRQPTIRRTIFEVTTPLAPDNKNKCQHWRAFRNTAEQLPLHASLYRTDRLHCISLLSGIAVGSESMAAVASWTSWASFPWKHRRHAQGLRVAALGEA